jgi:queuine tRNA-ribosyltransferase
MLLSEINVAYYQELMAGLRAAIVARGLADFAAETRVAWEQGDIPSR